MDRALDPRVAQRLAEPGRALMEMAESILVGVRDAGDRPVPERDEVLAGEVAAFPVIDRYAVHSVTHRSAIRNHNGRAPLDQSLDNGLICHGNEDYAISPMGEQHVNVGHLPRGVVSGVAHDADVTAAERGVFD